MKMQKPPQRTAHN